MKKAILEILEPIFGFAFSGICIWFVVDQFSSGQAWASQGERQLGFIVLVCCVVAYASRSKDD